MEREGFLVIFRFLSVIDWNWCRIYEGVIKKGDFIYNINIGKKIKVFMRVLFI